MVAGCDVREPPVEVTSVRDIGLAGSGVPPSGEAVAPISGLGGDGDPVAAAAPGWTPGAGAVRWHGGQWIIPYSAHPGRVVANMWCDVQPRADATDLVELVGQSGVIGSAAVPAATGVVIRAWILPTGGYMVHDGEQLVIRHSPRDATTGAWTSAAQDMTIVGCSVNEVETVTRPVWPVISYGSALIEEAGDPFGTTPVRKFRAQGTLYAEIPFAEGETLVGFSIELAGNGSVDSNLAILYGTRSGGQLQIGALTDFKDVPASWSTYRTSNFIPTRLSGNGKLSMALGANSPNLYWGHIWPVFTH